MIDWKRQGAIAVVTIDNPPVNAGSHLVRKGLLEAFSEIGADKTIEGVVLIGAGTTFISGSDIKEFGKPLADPQLPAVIEAIEKLAVPVAAAIRGAALGGGYELALGCDLRVADRKAVVGLPEVSLGLVPGAGGTQRLPRLTGIPLAIDLIVSARRVTAPEALSIAMIDAVSDGDLLDDTIAELRRLPAKRRVADMPVPAFDADEARNVMDKAVARAKNRPAALQAADLVMAGSQKAFRDALADERAAFQTIRVSPEAHAYRHIFFAERDAARMEKPGTTLGKVQNVAIVGGGTMGTAIAHAFLSTGHKVLLVERDEEALAAGERRVASLREDDLKRTRIDLAEANRQAAAFASSVELESVQAVDLVVEAVYEDIEVKRDLLKRLGAVVGPDTLLASNTSYLDLEAMVEGLPHPERFVGLHFFAPAHVMKLLEVVRSAKTSDATLAMAVMVAKRLGKQAIVARNSFGFVGNRIYAAYRRHAEFLIQDGATPEAVDRAMTEFGLAMGPFAVADLSGLDIAWKMRKAQAATRDRSQRYVDIADRLCEAGRLGRKTGAGYYSYASGKAAADPQVETYIAASRQAAGIVPQPIPDEEIRIRCLGAMLNEAARLFSEGILRQASDVDVALVHGYGFPRWTGGPAWWAAQLSKADRKTMLEQVARAEGDSFQPGDIDALIAGLS